MNRTLNVAFSVLVLMLINGCFWFDSGEIWRGGPYLLSWLDTYENISLSYDLGEGTSVGRIEEQVFAVGWDGHYLVAQQHPNGNKNIIDYYIIDAKKDSPMAEPKDVVIGPLTEAEYKVKAVELKLPKFTKELASLK